jgi:hypothetical protein
MNRTDLQVLAVARVADAEVLLAAERWPAAYYLLGYAVECGLKACISRQFHEHEVPDRKIVTDFYTHELERLLSISDVKPRKDERAKTDTAFKINWNLVRDWRETSRYDPLTDEKQARDMHAAVTDEKSGVLPWLKTMW